MLISIITPSFRNSEWLKLCVASVADQKGVEFEHIVQDSCSDDGTQDWLPHDKRVTAYIEKDAGMYDAVNRGFKHSKGEILAYLNCDEQYLPGALKAVHDFFEAHPEVDVVLPDTVITNAEGEYICHRYSLVPLANHVWIRYNVTTCSLFIRRRLIDEMNLYFDTKWRDLGDIFWVIEAVRRGVRFSTLRTFTSVFTETGDNMNFKANAVREKQIKIEMTPAWIKKFSRLFIYYHRFRMLANGAFTQSPFNYSIYTLADLNQRKTINVSRPTGLWHGRF